MSKFDINSIAIIGSGPAGLASLYEFLHTSKDGTSSVGGEKSKDPKFSNIVVFEQKDKSGGIWAPSLNKADLLVPPQDLLDSGKYSDPDVIHPPQKVPDNLEGTSYENPVETQGSAIANELEWRKSGVYSNLFTNIPSRFIRFSYLPDEEKYRNKERKIYPFLSHKELSRRIDDFSERESLNDYIRFNSRIEKVSKNDKGKWVLTIRYKDESTHKEKWYEQQFDAVVVANGHYTVPNIPYIPGLAEFNKNFPGSIIHAKSYRSVDEFKGRKVLVLGYGFSAANLVQYIAPVAKETIIVKRGPHLVFEWINTGLASTGLINKPEVERIDPIKNEVIFKDGSVEKNVDKILLATGYHYHYPFLHDYLKVIDPSNVSRVGGLYYNTFSIDDPTLAAVGVAVSTINFHTIEASAAAIAGVWSGVSSLPSKKEQKEWESKLVSETGNNLFFHYYTHPRVKEDFVDKLHVYAPKNRPNPLEKDEKHISDIDEGGKSLERLFYDLKDGKLKIEDTVYNE